ncbi:MAG: RNA polymerase subunit sigma, partial [Pseudomonadota bacterium]
MMTKAELEGVLTRMALGEREAFDQIYEATSATLFGLCLHILEDSAAAEEALLEAYTTIWR